MVSVAAVTAVIREGRCCLETSVACFKFYLFFGTVVAYAKNVLTLRNTYYSELVFLFQDLVQAVVQEAKNRIYLYRRNFIGRFFGASEIFLRPRKTTV